MWVFDDPRVGLVREPFVAGMPAIIEELVKNIPNAEAGFTLLFSPTPFPGNTLRMEWSHGECGGNWYNWKEKDLSGWLCPALFLYFAEAPSDLFAQALPLLEEGRALQA